jgi:hypothetical protein
MEIKINTLMVISNGQQKCTHDGLLFTSADLWSS